jgi:hypothetical protein
MRRAIPAVAFLEWSLLIPAGIGSLGGWASRGELAMPTNTPAPLPEQACERCGAATTLATFLPRFGDRPAYRIFDCPACKALTWVAEAITGSDPQE